MSNECGLTFDAGEPVVEAYRRLRRHLGEVNVEVHWKAAHLRDVYRRLAADVASIPRVSPEQQRLNEIRELLSHLQPPALKGTDAR